LDEAQTQVTLCLVDLQIVPSGHKAAAHSSKSSRQVFPAQPIVHKHSKSPWVFIHLPSLLHRSVSEAAALAHSSTSISQNSPCQLAGVELDVMKILMNVRLILQHAKTVAFAETPKVASLALAQPTGKENFVKSMLTSALTRPLLKPIYVTMMVNV
jgi:hypothetical protein